MKKEKTIESLENQANVSTKVSRVKQNFRPVLFERAGIIEEEMILKVLVHLDTKETQAIVQKEMSESLHYSISQGYLMQIMDTSATKWNGVKTILEHLQCDIADAVYFGDDNDDIGPIRSCGLGVAVANGIPAVKAVADAITESNDHDGVAKFIEQQILKE